ncbi:PorT family protein [Hymenobacter sp. BT507]|uniref:PorT family protein n=1 Tax=Hymenobacter citatus TaxID=2763506 RepID=A0ABR7MHM5_9BACT|nr:porin family protein [Hymenobacter citatus]MBC6610379.1 PorT family protein [Hymenobacter citatus]
MKLLLLSMSGLLVATAAEAQFGVRAGANYASLAESRKQKSYYAEADGRIGYQVGVFYERRISERISLVPEVQFSRQRTNLSVVDYDAPMQAGAATYQVGLSYLNVPIMVRAHLRKFYVELGPQGSILLGAHEKGFTEESPLSSYRDPAGGTPFDRRATDHYHRYDFGTIVGLGVALSTGFEVGMRIYAGLLSDTRGASSPYPGKLNNVVIQTNMAYRFLAH